MPYELLLATLSRSAELHKEQFCQCIGQHLIAAYLARHDFRAKVYYGEIETALPFLLQEADAHGVRSIGFYVAADNVVMIGNLLRALRPETRAFLFVGGPEAAALGEDFLRETGCDAVIAGEGERPVLQLLRYLEDGVGSLEAVDGLRFLDENGRFHARPPGEPIADLDAMPWPDPANSLQKNYRMGKSIGMLTGRGCPFHCAFCFEGAASKHVRLRSVENVMAEIDEVRRANPSLQRVNFFDDTFTLDSERVYAFCDALKRRGLQWACEGHAACLHRRPEMIEAMVESGLVGMQIGIESGSARVLEAYQKNASPEAILEVVQICHRAGLPSLEGNYIIGGAQETDETLSESLAHAKRLIEAGRGMIELHTVFFAPYCGTPITKHPERFGMRLCPDRVAKTVQTMQEPVAETDSLSVGALLDWKERFDRELWAQYQAQAALCTKTDLLRGPSPFGLSATINTTWRRAWFEIPHLSGFLQRRNPAEHVYAPDKYPIRLGTGKEYPDGSLSIDGVRLPPLAARAWYHADGRRTGRALGESLRLSAAETEALYQELNRQCLVYFSAF